MKRILTVLASIALVASLTVANAQKKDFNGYWFMQLQGGAAHTIGETSFSELISPSAAVSLGYQFSPVFGARLNVNGWQGKGAVVGTSNSYEVYKWNYVEGAVDVMADLAAIFAGYKYDRTLNPYIFGGVGANYAFDNDEAAALYKNGCFPTDPDYYWDDNNISPALRAGLGLNIRLSDVIAFNIEGNCSFLNDHFNSKKGSKADFQIKAVAGLTFSFGKAKPAPAPVPAPAPAPVVKEPEPEPEPVVEKVIEEPAFESLTRNILFVINKWDIRDSEQLKIDEVVEALKANPDTKVRVSGYADKATGTPKRNQFLSQKRSEVVAEAIVNAGIAKDRIITEYFGDTVNPFETPEENRVAVCLVK